MPDEKKISQPLQAKGLGVGGTSLPLIREWERFYEAC